MGNVSAGTQLINQEETDFAMTGLWYRLSDKINRWKNADNSSKVTSLKSQATVLDLGH